MGDQRNGLEAAKEIIIRKLNMSRLLLQHLEQGAVNRHCCYGDQSNLAEPVSAVAVTASP